MSSEQVLGTKDLPAIHRAADAASLSGQRWHRRTVRVGLFVLIAAAITGLFTLKIGPADWAGVAAALIFFIGVLVELNRVITRPERAWYEGRAIAESAKTLAWRYAVGGSPFPVTMPAQQADSLLSQQLAAIVRDTKHVVLDYAGDDPKEITDAMRLLRSKSLAERKAAYATGRVQDQFLWYAGRAKLNRRRVRQWTSVLFLTEVCGATAAIFKAIGLLQLDLLGVIGTVAAAATSWLESRQHATQAQSYSVAASELAAIRARLDLPDTEQEWAAFVNDAESAVSREHTLWLAAHTDKG